MRTSLLKLGATWGIHCASSQGASSPPVSFSPSVPSKVLRRSADVHPKVQTEQAPKRQRKDLAKVREQPMKPNGTTQQIPARVVTCLQELSATASAVSRTSAPYWGCAEVNAALAAAKPIAWRGSCDLVQLPWDPRVRGQFVVLDLWAGIGGLLLALVSLGCRCVVLAAESDDKAARCHARAFPQAVLFRYVEDVQASMLDEVLTRRDVAAIIVAGGCPRLRASPRNTHRQGNQDERSQHAGLMNRLVGDCRRRFHVPVISMLENVASLPPAELELHSTLMGARPVACQSGQFGWVSRNRLYWLAGPLGGADELEKIKLPPTLAMESSPGRSRIAGALTYHGKRPIPERIGFSNGYLTIFDPRDVVKNKGKGAAATFTQEFFHSTDRKHQASPRAQQRFEQDARRFPVASYEDHSLLWLGDKWRQWNPCERAQAMGIPPSILAPFDDDGTVPLQQRTALQASAIGNGFHVPTLMAMLIILFQLLEPVHASRISGTQEDQLRRRLAGSCFEPGRAAVFPGILDASDIVNSMRVQLDVLNADDAIWSEVLRSLSAIPLSELQLYYVFCRMRDQNIDDMGPAWINQRNRPFSAASFWVISEQLPQASEALITSCHQALGSRHTSISPHSSTATLPAPSRLTQTWILRPLVRLCGVLVWLGSGADSKSSFGS